MVLPLKVVDGVNTVYTRKSGVGDRVTSMGNGALDVSLIRVTCTGAELPDW
jgi:hypothetical protein